MIKQNKTEFILCSLPNEYDPIVEQLIGRLILLYGQIDRLLVEAIKFQANPNLDNKQAIAIVRDRKNGLGMTLGDWIKWIEKDSLIYNISQNWLDEVKNKLSNIKSTRDMISHDTLLLNKDDILKWRTNQNKNDTRKHRTFDIDEIKSALDIFYEFKNFISQNSI